MDDMFTILPCLRLRISPRTAIVAKYGPQKCVLRESRKSSMVITSSGPTKIVPALLTRMSTGPKCWRIWSRAASASSRMVISLSIPFAHCHDLLLGLESSVYLCENYSFHFRKSGLDSLAHPRLHGYVSQYLALRRRR